MVRSQQWATRIILFKINSTIIFVNHFVLLVHIDRIFYQLYYYCIVWIVAGVRMQAASSCISRIRATVPLEAWNAWIIESHGMQLHRCRKHNANEHKFKTIKMFNAHKIHWKRNVWIKHSLETASNASTARKLIKRQFPLHPLINSFILSDGKKQIYPVRVCCVRRAANGKKPLRMQLKWKSINQLGYNQVAECFRGRCSLLVLCDSDASVGRKIRALYAPHFFDTLHPRYHTSSVQTSTEKWCTSSKIRVGKCCVRCCV